MADNSLRIALRASGLAFGLAASLAICGAASASATFASADVKHFSPKSVLADVKHFPCNTCFATATLPVTALAEVKHFPCNTCMTDSSATARSETKRFPPSGGDLT